MTQTEVANNSSPATSGFGIFVSAGSSSASNANDTFTNNTLNFGSFSLDASATGAMVVGNVVKNGDGFENAADNVTFLNNTATGNGDNAFVSSGNDDSFLNNTANNNEGTGFDLSGSGMLVSGNIANKNTDGSGFQISSDDVTVTGNTANSDRLIGFSIAGDAPTVTNNTANNAG